MIKKIKIILTKIFDILSLLNRDWEDKNLILQANNLMQSNHWQDNCHPINLIEKEFRVYSQWGDDGIIQFLIKKLNIRSKNFIEFGVSDFFESNTHFLLVNNNWNGFVIDGSTTNIETLRKSPIYWRYNIKSETAFITKDNINQLISLSNFNQIGLLHIDLDGNDYWILDSIDIAKLAPDILILEYNSNFGFERPITIPYEENFSRLKSHHSGQYFGASLKALKILAEKKDYYFIGSNSAGNNAYFLLNKYKSIIPEVKIEDGYVSASFRDSRNENNKLSFLSREDSIREIRGLNVYNIVTKEIEKF